jgi:hypothetical protein
MRMLLRSLLMLAFACCAVIDGTLGFIAIYGADGATIGADGKFQAARSEPSLWIPSLAFVALQALLVVGIIRLRPPSAHLRLKLKP